jgi:hypothetical protein
MQIMLKDERLNDIDQLNVLGFVSQPNLRNTIVLSS